MDNFTLDRSRRNLLLGSLGLLTGAARAQEGWPTKPVRIVQSGAPGGASSVVVRILTEPLRQELGQNFYDESKSGPGGIVAAQAVLGAPADGYSYFLTSLATQVLLPELRSKLPFDPNKDFTPVVHLVGMPQVIYVRDESPIKSIGQLISYAKANPGKVSYGSLGVGTTTHLMSVLLTSRTGTDLLHVPHKGSAPMLTAVLGGHLEVGVDLLPGTIAQIRDGRVRALAVTSKQRFAGMSDVPTLSESVAPGFEASSWFGLVAKVGTPAPIIDKLQATVGAIMKRPEVQKRYIEFGAEPRFLGPQEFQRQMAEEKAKWTPVVRNAGIKID